jgi:allantoinase
MTPLEEPVDLSLVGHILSPSVDLPHGEIQVRGGKISALHERPAASGFRRRIDVGDAHLLPGLVDAHVHALSHPGEGIAAATRSAAAGGVTTIVDMPFDAAGPISSVERFEQKRAVVEREAFIDVALMATVRPGSEADGTISALADHGACGFKVSTFETDPRRFPRLVDPQLVDAFSAIAATGRPVAVHAENNDLIKRNLALLHPAGETDPLAHCRARPWYAETSAVAAVIELARATDVKVHFCHLSLPRSIDMASAARREGMSVSVETCPHYLVFSEDEMAVQKGRLKMNPPLRRGDDVAGLWARLAGEIDLIASDHAPWPLEDKTRQNIFDNHSGLPGTETMFGVVADAMDGHAALDLATLVRLMSSRPAQLYGLDHRKGDLQPGMDADIIVYTQQPQRIDEGRLHSNAGWSPYHDRCLRGSVTHTISRGELVWSDGTLRGTAGRGTWLRAFPEQRTSDGS